MNEDLYYTAPSDKVFFELQAACRTLWVSLTDEGMYRHEKLTRCDVENYRDNFMYLFGMLDEINQQRVLQLVSEETKKAIRDRIEAGGGEWIYE